MKNFYRFCVFVAQLITLGLAAAFLVSVISPRFVERLRQTIVPGSESAAPAVTPAPPPSVTQSAPDHHVTSPENAPEDLITA